VIPFARLSLAALMVLALPLAAQTAPPQVSTRSGLELQISGMILLNGFYNSDAVNNSDVPLYASRPDTTSTLPVSGFGGTARQSRLTLVVTSPDVLGASMSGELDVDFFGGQEPSTGGRFFPLLRIRRTRLDLWWTHVNVMIGQEVPLIAELNPRSLASIGIPGFAGAGNLWFWIPQARVGVETGETIRVGVDGAVLAPSSYEAQGNEFTTQHDIAERSGRPSVEARGRLGWRGESTSGEVSIGGHLGWLATDGDSLLDSKAVAASARLRPLRLLELRGEVYTGEGVAGLGSGAIGQNFGLNGVPIGTTAWWAQLNVLPSDAWELGGGVGIDDPKDEDIDPATQRSKNTVWEVHAIWRPAPLVVGLEFRRLETEYGANVNWTWTTNHVNLALGFEF